ncbi:hypothetical protein ATZ33_12390 [Enterococcus silesiacus]|uniref:LHH domain-containing protein n=2 Tax=Enterococcus silesiacus TaxID=332949 RepID=A0ABN4J8F7_9ENTE|nr:hypothetical protein ATZ33_12390 [Enterococcus silesiacus]
MEEACKKFPEQYTADVDSSDLKSEELEKEIEELENNITHVQSLQRELHHFPVPKLVKQILMHQNQKSLTRDLEAKRELEQKLQKLQDFHTSSPTIFSEISALKATIDQGVAQANQSWNASTGQFTIPSGKKMDWANTIKNSWATRDKRLMEKQLKEYQIYAVIYNDKDGKPKIIWKVTKDGAGVKNPKIYQYLNANGKDLPADLFEFMSQHDWDDKVKVAFRNGKDLQIGDKYNPVLGALVASGQYLEDAYKFMTEDELGQALQMLGFNFASYRLATNKGTKTVENKKAGGATVPKDYSQIREYWKKDIDFKGTRVYQRDGIIDINKVDVKGRSNLQRMEQGLAPLGPDANPVNLHHMTQRDISSIAEVEQSFHQSNSKTIHINPNSVPSGIDRKSFNKWRSEYWKNRAKDFK